MTGKAGHADVENHDFGLHAGKHLDGFESVGGHVHFMAIETQQHRKRFAGIAIVVGHENAPQCREREYSEWTGADFWDLHRAAD